MSEIEKTKVIETINLLIKKHEASRDTIDSVLQLEEFSNDDKSNVARRFVSGFINDLKQFKGAIEND